MATFLDAETNLLEEIGDRICALTPDWESTKPFQRYRAKNEDLGSLSNQFIAPRQFMFSHGQTIATPWFGYSYNHSQMVYELTIQYPRTREWTRAANADVMQIKSALINTGPTTSGVQQAFCLGDTKIEATDNEKDPFITVTIPITVWYSVTV